MNAPQIIVICIMALSLGIGIEQHGKEKTGKNNIWTTLLSVVIWVGLLIWGGFWG